MWSVSAGVLRCFGLMRLCAYSRHTLAAPCSLHHPLACACRTAPPHALSRHTHCRLRAAGVHVRLCLVRGCGWLRPLSAQLQTGVCVCVGSAQSRRTQCVVCADTFRGRVDQSFSQALCLLVGRRFFLTLFNAQRTAVALRACGIHRPSLLCSCVLEVEMLRCLFLSFFSKWVFRAQLAPRQPIGLCGRQVSRIVDVLCLDVSWTWNTCIPCTLCHPRCLNWHL